MWGTIKRPPAKIELVCGALVGTLPINDVSHWKALTINNVSHWKTFKFNDASHWKTLTINQVSHCKTLTINDVSHWKTRRASHTVRALIWSGYD